MGRESLETAAISYTIYVHVSIYSNKILRSVRISIWDRFKKVVWK